jgi:hypothetical protein
MAKRIYINSNNILVIADSVDTTIDTRNPASNIYTEINGITIRDGQSFKTIVKDDLSALTYLEAKVMGVLKPI